MVRVYKIVSVLLHHREEQPVVQTTWHDDDERQVIEDVQQYGWHIVLIKDDPEGPASTRLEFGTR